MNEAASYATPYFDAIRPWLDRMGDAPALTALNAMAREQDLRNAYGRPIRFVESAVDERHYESRIAESGDIVTRDNRHDLFNGLQWLAIPRTKAVINRMHADFLAQGGATEARSRSAARDALTLFDENGILVASDDASLLQLIRDFKWNELFLDRRVDVQRHMRFWLTGHGVLERALTPYVGLTAKAWLIKVDVDFFERPFAGQLDWLDLQAAQWIADARGLTTPRNLSPLPLLGIPGWDARNAEAAFYDNTDYFRAGRSHRPA